MSIFMLLLLIIIIACAVKLSMPALKGRHGEAVVKTTLYGLDGERYRVVNNVMLSSEGGNTRSTQIDHVVVSIYGIFVIETKRYKGWIYGSETSRQWTQNIYGNKYRFMNPVRQSYAHVKAMERFILSRGHSSVLVRPIVVFTGSCTLKVRTENAYVVKRNKVLSVIRSLSCEPCLTKSEVDEIVSLLAKHRGNPAKMREHAAEIKDFKIEKQKKIYAGICPRCGAGLVIRNGRYGKFYGCSSYPRCRFTESLR